MLGEGGDLFSGAFPIFRRLDAISGLACEAGTRIQLAAAQTSPRTAVSLWLLSVDSPKFPSQILRGRIPL